MRLKLAVICYRPEAIPYQYYMVATLPKDGGVSIAVDDISITSGECNAVGNADFEHDSGGYKNEPTNSQKWVIGQSYENLTNLPDIDHTEKNSNGM